MGGLSVWRGKFRSSSGSVTLDAAARRARVDITIDPASVDFGMDALDAEAKGPDMFDVAKYPTATSRASWRSSRTEPPPPSLASSRFTALQAPEADDPQLQVRAESDDQEADLRRGCSRDLQPRGLPHGLRARLRIHDGRESRDPGRGHEGRLVLVGEILHHSEDIPMKKICAGDCPGLCCRRDRRLRRPGWLFDRGYRRCRNCPGLCLWLFRLFPLRLCPVWLLRTRLVQWGCFHRRGALVPWTARFLRARGQSL